jgi:hypothetical protein
MADPSKKYSYEEYKKLIKSLECPSGNENIPFIQYCHDMIDDLTVPICEKFKEVEEKGEKITYFQTSCNFICKCHDSGYMKPYNSCYVFF